MKGNTMEDQTASDGLNIRQGTDAWLKLRVGKVTASRVADVIAKTKSGYSASREKYAGELIAEILTGQSAPSFSNAAMQWGTDTEPQARAAYEFLNDVTVEEVGLVDHPSIEMSAASPDGLVGKDGMLEIKCPNTNTHIDTLISQKVPKKYNTQMQWQMACAERDWCDFVSFDPRLPMEYQIFCVRVERDDEFIAELEKEITTFHDEIQTKIDKLKEVVK